MDSRRILDLALETLNRRKKELETQIEEIRAELVGRETSLPPTNRSAMVRPGHRRPRTRAERKAQSDRMKAFWASKKLRMAKASNPVKPSATGRKRISRKAAGSRVPSLKPIQASTRKKGKAAKRTSIPKNLKAPIAT